MKALLVAKQGREYEHQYDTMCALANGMARHGIETRVKPSPASPRPDDNFIVTWCDKLSLQENGAHHLILECGYINGIGRNYKKNRLRFISTSWNQRHGLSDWDWSQELTDERWNKLNIDLLPWKQGGEYVLLLEQRFGDKAAPDVGRFRRQITDECLRRDWPCRIRRHPCHYHNQHTLAEDLANASLAITWCSTSAVEAVIAGVPTYTLGPGSIAAPVTRASLSDTPYTGDRTVWANRLAHRQWSMDELRCGLAWPHIHNGLTGGSH